MIQQSMLKTGFLAICATFLILSLASCSKDVTSSIVGKWNVVNDSVSLPIANLLGSNYIGTSNDYYDFTVNGVVFINENSVKDTATYSTSQNNQIAITYSNGSISSFVITKLTAHAATLSYLYAGPTRIINLRR
jgi:hypothetical protein